MGIVFMCRIICSKATLAAIKAIAVAVFAFYTQLSFKDGATKQVGAAFEVGVVGHKILGQNDEAKF